jgi:hypothetical protein
MRISTIIALGVAAVACAPAGSTGPGSPDLSEEYGCGYGFYLGNASQTAGLLLNYVDFAEAGVGDVVRSAQLTDRAWQAELRFGSDLFANWCDDVIEPGEPEPVIDEVWRVSGQIDVTGLPPAGQCGPASATLSGLTARNAEGEVIPLGDLEVENQAWGCFAG